MKRRDFISTGLALGAGVVATSTLVHNTAIGSAESGPVRAAVIGCGRQGRAIINAGMKIPDLKFVAVCDIQKSALNSAKFYLEYEDEETSVAAYTDFDDLLEKERGKIDAVIIATPDFVHAAQAIAAFRAGLHVYCESPMATNADDAREMIREAKKAEKLLQVGFERRSDPRYRHAASRLLNPESRELLLGTLTHCETLACRRVHRELIWAERDTLAPEILAEYGYGSMSEYRNWKQYRRYGKGQCMVNIAQQLDVLEWFLGVRPESLQVNGGLDFYTFGDCPDNITAMLNYRFPHGPVRGISRAWTTTSVGGSLPWEHLFGEFGSVQSSLSAGEFRLHAEPGLAKWDAFLKQGDLKKATVSAEGEDPNLIKVRETGNVVPYILPMERPDSVMRLHLENFVNATFGRETLNCSGENAFPAHLIAWKIDEAVGNNTMFRFDEEMFVL